MLGFKNIMLNTYSLSDPETLDFRPWFRIPSPTSSLQYNLKLSE